MSDPLSTNDLDAIGLSALVSSRVCHDLINPVGAVSSGLEVLDDPTMDAEMREAALNLVRDGANKAIALLKYARLAYGAAGGFGAEINLEDAKEALQLVYATTKADLDWRLAPAMAPKEQVKTLMVLAYAAVEAIHRGGTVTVSGTPSEFEIVATGPRIFLSDDLTRAVQGDGADLAPKFAPLFIVSQLVAGVGGELVINGSDEKLVFKVNFLAREAA